MGVLSNPITLLIVLGFICVTQVALIWTEDSILAQARHNSNPNSNSKTEAAAEAATYSWDLHYDYRPHENPSPSPSPSPSRGSTYYDNGLSVQRLIGRDRYRHSGRGLLEGNGTAFSFAPTNESYSIDTLGG